VAGTGAVRRAATVRDGLRSGPSGAWRSIATIRLPERAADGGPDRPRRAVVAERAFDVTGALLLGVAMLPVLVALSVAVKAESPGPVLYRARRVGYRGSRLALLKFRKMRHDAQGPHLTVRADPRLTGVGRFLVRTHLDELPQLWHVLRGEMSLVGPRPEDPRFVACHHDAYEEVLSVRPGLTGWTQLVLADEGAVLAEADDPVQLYLDEILPAKVALDAAYVGAGGVLGDAKVLAWTVLVLVFGFAVVVDTDRRELRLVRPSAEEPAGLPLAADLAADLGADLAVDLAG
jgi:lipopolysaccharide/colanic/teichoic acid biosynthesis glycosyltransferase